VAPPKRLSSAIGAFGCGGPVGTALALIGGGWLVHNQDRLGDSLPWAAGSVWRAAFLMCAAFGALAAVLLLTVTEPYERNHASPLNGGLRATVLHLRRHWRVFSGVSGAMLALSFCVFATSSWSPTMLVRVHGMSYAGVAPVTGLAALLGGVAGAWTAGVATDRLEASGRLDAPLQVAMVVSALIVVTMGAAVLTPSVGWAAASVCVTYSLLGMPTVLGGTALQQISPPAIRAQVMAIQVVLVNLIALSLGPLTVAVLTDHVLGRSASVGYALVLTDGLGAVAAIGAILACRHRFVEQRIADRLPTTWE
jgi:MFS family permease